MFALLVAAPLVLTPPAPAPACSDASRGDDPRGAADGPPVAGIVGWWRAEAGLELGVSNLVARWVDQSGAGLDLTQEEGQRRPWLDRFALSGQEGLRFDGNDELARPDGLPAGDYTKVCLFVADDASGGGQLLSGTGGHALRLAPGDPRLRVEHAGEAVLSTIPLAEGEPVIVVATYASATGVATLYQDGVPVGAGVLPAPGETSLRVGATDGGYPLRGRMLEVMLFDTVLGAGQRAAVELYLQGTYLAPGFPNVAFDALPRDGQLLPRDGAGSAQVAVQGRVQTPGYERAKLTLFRDGLVWKELTQDLSYGAGGEAPFALAATIEAGLVEYDALVSLLAGAVELPVNLRVNLVCGDAYLVTGQSNAMARDFHGEELGNQSQSPWLRSFGSGELYAGWGPPGLVAKAGPPADAHWDVAEGLVPHAHATVGQWALRMAERLHEEQGVPVAVLSGAVEGTSVALHQRNDANPADPTGLYGRLLGRARAAGIDQSVRALIYYQGEIDGPVPAFWDYSFGQLRSDWLEDYPALERIVAMQVRQGCAIPNDGVREVQRTLGEVYPDVRVMSTTAAPTHDGCHYYYAGYREIGERLARLLSQELFGTPGGNVHPPRLASARWTSPARDQLLLSFTPNQDALVWDAGSEAYLTLDDGTAVVAGAAVGSTLVLDLAGPSTATTVTWSGHVGDGPWIANANGVGALTFFGFEIEP
ncbi:MAG: sialate O-acetylesterase [Planctomycetota bacterium]